METSQYEKSYREARERLTLRGKNVGKATCRDGLRYCPVEGLLLPDRDIFVEAWSEEVADTILQEHSALNSNVDTTASSHGSCADCEQLRSLYTVSNDTYLEILRLKIEVSGFCGWLSKDLLDALCKKRDAALQTLMDHEKSHGGMTMGGAVHS